MTIPKDKRFFGESILGQDRNYYRVYRIEEGSFDTYHVFMSIANSVLPQMWIQIKTLVDERVLGSCPDFECIRYFRKHLIWHSAEKELPDYYVGWMADQKLTNDLRDWLQSTIDQNLSS